MAKQHRPVSAKNRIIQDTDHSDLVLYGDSSFIRPTHEDPDVQDYAGHLYRHEFFHFSPTKGFQEYQDSRYIQQVQHDIQSNSQRPGPIQPSVEIDGKRGLFNPHSRPPSGKRNQHSIGVSSYANTDGMLARPNSVASTVRPASGASHLPGGETRPGSVSRAASRARPSSACSKDGRHTGLGSPEQTWNTDTFDPDHEPIGEVLSRLGEYTQNFSVHTVPACVDCECGREEQRLSSRQTKMYDSGSEDSSSDEGYLTVYTILWSYKGMSVLQELGVITIEFLSLDCKRLTAFPLESELEDCGISFDVLMKTFKQYEEKGHSASRQKAMLTLVNSYTGVTELTDAQLEQVLVYVRTGASPVQDASLVLMKQCIKHEGTVRRLLEHRFLDFLHDSLCQQPLFHLRKNALPLMEAILAKGDHMEAWYESAFGKYVPKLISMIRGQTPLDIKYGACCVFRSIAKYVEFLPLVTEQILPCVVNMRNASAKFKEVYVQILTALIAYTEQVPSDLIDTSAVPIAASIIREGPCGPQSAALHLLSTLTPNDAGVAMVIGTDSLVAMLLCCMKDSHCRKVRMNATEVIRNMCTCRKLGLCKDFMMQLSGYLVPSMEQDSITSLSKMAASINVAMPAKPRFDEERHMWQGLEKFIDLTKNVIFREAKVEVDDLGLATHIHMKPCIDTCPTMLSLVSDACYILQHMCLWPLDKSRLGFSANKVNLTTFTDDDRQRARLSKVNRGLTQSIWDKVGVVVTDLLYEYASKFSKMLNDPNKGMKSCRLEFVFEAEEVTLIHSLLELLLCSALCTCVAFPEILPKLEEKPVKRRSKSPSKLKSSSSSQVTNCKCNDTVESRLKSQSDTGRGFATEEEKIWVRENPHLTGSRPHAGAQETSAEQSKAQLRHKEACTERRLLRKCLYEADVFACVSPFLLCNEEHVQVKVLQILRCLVQPLEERVAPKLSFSGDTSGKARNRPQTAGAVQSANKRLNIALYRMSPDVAGIIKEALGHQDLDGTGASTGETKAPAFDIPGSTNGLDTIQERLQEFAESSKAKSEHKPSGMPEPVCGGRGKPVIDRCIPIALQCRSALAGNVGERLITGIFSKSQLVKKHYVLLLHDFVLYGEAENNMALSRFSCIPKLLDFLRVNENNELLEIIGLITVRLLVTSDPRLKQLFNRHGGQQLLLSMVQYTSGLLKQEVSNTIKAMSKGAALRRRPMSAPVRPLSNSNKQPDVWDHIQARWKQEDQVTNVLRQWMVEDRQHHRKQSSYLP